VLQHETVRKKSPVETVLTLALFWIFSRRGGGGEIGKPSLQRDAVRFRAECLVGIKGAEASAFHPV